MDRLMRGKLTEMRTSSVEAEKKSFKDCQLQSRLRLVLKLVLVCFVKSSGEEHKII